MKLSGFTKWGMVVVGVFFLVYVVLMFMASGGEKKTKAAITDDSRCPDCGMVLPKRARASGICPNCEITKGPEAARAARARRQQGFASGPVIPSILVGVFCLLLATHLLIALRRRYGGQQDELELFYKCPKCGRRLRYREHQIGQAGKCPLCRRVFIFPRPLQQELPKRGIKAVGSYVRSLLSRGEARK